MSPKSENCLRIQIDNSLVENCWLLFREVSHSFPEVNLTTFHNFAIILGKFVSTYSILNFFISCGPFGHQGFKMILNLVPLWPQPQIISIEKNPSPKLLRDIEFGPIFGIFKRCGFWWLSDFHVTHLSGLPTKVLTVHKASTTHHLRCLWPFLQAQQLGCTPRGSWQ